MTESFVFGLSTATFREKPIQEAINLLSRIGLKYVDLVIVLPDYCPHYDPMNTTPENDKVMADLFRKNELIVSSLNVVPGFFNHGNPLITKQYLIRCFQLANELGTKIITIPAGAKRMDHEWESNVFRVKSHLDEMAEYALQYGVVLSIEAPHVSTLVETPEQAKSFFEIIDNPLIKCTFDTSHVRRGEKYQLTEAARLIGTHLINHIHLRDAFRESVIITPGKGTSDFKDFFQLLKNIEYKGYLNYELEFHGYNTEKVLNEIQFAIKFCTNAYENKIKKDIQYNPYYNSVKRFLNSPKAEIQNYPQVYRRLQTIYAFLHQFLPEKVFEGKYVEKIRINKRKTIRFPKNSVQIQNPSNRKIRVGIIGLGTVGLKWHAEGFNRLKDVEIIGGYDIDAKKNLIFSKKYDVELCKNLQEIFERKPHLVAICTREWDHYEIAKETLENGIDIFCEKIFTSKIQHAEELIKTATEKGRTIALNYNYRYMPGIIKIKELIDSGVLGRLSWLNINVNVLAYAHALDLLSFLGGHIKNVSGSIIEDYYKRSKVFDWNLFDSDIQYIPSKVTNVTVQFKNGALGVINSTVDYDFNKFIISVEAAFEKSVVSLSGINMFNTIGIITHSSEKDIKGLNLNIDKNIYHKRFGYTFFESIRDFMECYINNVPVPTDGKKALFNMQLEKLINQSSSEGRRISIEHFQQ